MWMVYLFHSSHLHNSHFYSCWTLHDFLCFQPFVDTQSLKRYIQWYVQSQCLLLALCQKGKRSLLFSSPQSLPFFAQLVCQQWTCELGVENGESKRAEVRNFVQQGRTGQAVQVVLPRLFVLVKRKETAEEEHFKSKQKINWHRGNYHKNNTDHKVAGVGLVQ